MPLKFPGEFRPGAIRYVAALVIQGSACVYSKKVEYLYSFVFNTLNLIVTEKERYVCVCVCVCVLVGMNVCVSV